LDQLRDDIFHSGTVVRDYLVEPDEARAASQKAELEFVRTRIDDTLSRYERTFPQPERSALTDLRNPRGFVLAVFGPGIAMGLRLATATRRKVFVRRHTSASRRDRATGEAGDALE
jgi:hypothetical protein